MDSKLRKKLLQYVGYPLFFIVCFGMFFALAFPGDRFVPAVESRLGVLLGRKVTVEDISLTPLWDIRLTGIRIEVPSSDDEKPNQSPGSRRAGQDTDATGKDGEGAKKSPPRSLEYYIEELYLDLSLTSLLLGDLDVELEMDFLGGTLEIEYSGAMSLFSSAEEEVKGPPSLARRSGNAGGARRNARSAPSVSSDEESDSEDEEKAGEDDPEEEGFSIRVRAIGMEMSQLYDLRSVLPLPILGTVDFEAEMTSSTGKLADSDGEMSLVGQKMSIGRKKSKVALIDGMDPLTVDSIEISEMELRFAIAKGAGKVSRSEFKSKDIDFSIQGDVNLGDPFRTSRFNLYFMFRMLDGYSRKSENAKTLVSLMGMVPQLTQAKRNDDFYGFAFRGPWRVATFRPSKVFRTAGEDRGSRSRNMGASRSSRPRPVSSPSVAREATPPAQPPRPQPLQAPDVDRDDDNDDEGPIGREALALQREQERREVPQQPPEEEPPVADEPDEPHGSEAPEDGHDAPAEEEPADGGVNAEPGENVDESPDE